MLFVSLLFLLAAEPQTVSGEVTTVRFAPEANVVQLWVKDGQDDRTVYVAKDDTKLLWDNGLALAPVTLRQVVGRLVERRAEVRIKSKMDEPKIAAEAVFKYLPAEKK